MSYFDAQKLDIAALAADDRLRSLSPRKPVDFASNDYLGFAGKGLLRSIAQEALDSGVAIGSKGSRLLGGNDRAHESLEAYAADMFGTEAALSFSSGFAANSALFATLPQRGDLILYDALIHASVHDGMRLTRADTRSFAHNNAEYADHVAHEWRASGGKGRIWIALEGLYSMDGDYADLISFQALAQRHEAILVVDEAHSLGTIGARSLGLTDVGEGIKAPENLIRLITCGKSLGAEGALLLGPAIMRDFLVNRARHFIFSTAPSPLMARIAEGALKKLASEPQHREDLEIRLKHAHALLPSGLATPSHHSVIMPILIGDNGRTMELAAALQSLGLDVRGIRPPTVPAGTSRLRISISNNVSLEQIDTLFNALADLTEVLV